MGKLRANQPGYKKSQDKNGRTIWVPSEENKSSSSDLGDMKSDFQQEESLLTPQEQKTIDCLYDFENYLIMRKGISQYDFEELEENDEKWEHLTEFLESSQGKDYDTDDFSYIQDEINTHGFERIYESTTVKENQEKSRKLLAERTKGKNSIYKKYNYPTASISDDASDYLKDKYRSRIIEDEETFDSFDDYLNSPSGHDDYYDAIELMKEDISFMVEEWAERLPKRTQYLIIEGEGLGWRGRSGYKVVTLDDFKKNNVSIIAQNHVGVSQEWEQTLGKELRIRQSHHDSYSESYVVTPTTKKKFEEYYNSM